MIKIPMILRITPANQSNGKRSKAITQPYRFIAEKFL